MEAEHPMTTKEYEVYAKAQALVWGQLWSGSGVKPFGLGSNLDYFI